MRIALWRSHGSHANEPDSERLQLQLAWCTRAMASEYASVQLTTKLVREVHPCSISNSCSAHTSFWTESAAYVQGAVAHITVLHVIWLAAKWHHEVPTYPRACACCPDLRCAAGVVLVCHLASALPNLGNTATPMTVDGSVGGAGGAGV